MTEHLTSLRSLLVGSCHLSVGLTATLLYGENCEKTQRPLWGFESRPVGANVTTHEVGTSVIVLFSSPVHENWPEQPPTVPTGRVPMEGCKVTCLLTRDRYRGHHQRWVHWNMEAPSNSFIDTKPERLRGVFNWKFTYRNGTTAAQTSLLPARGSRVWTKRSALVVWAASNLRTPSKREQFVEEHVEVDVCGRCGDRSTSSLSEKLECLRFVGHTYYFYLCMEGALCVDYVTEKFANPVAHGMIPVVLGDYLSRAAAAPPPRSYVDTQWFPMLLHLVAHLRMVAADPDFFERHFNWRATGTIVIDCTTTIAHCARRWLRTLCP
ncbi:glycoprotein 3-alpha-L-fucosyltransferase A-like [Dermacentor silvarum]|uniref:glycoprotein 3-alpha-L-fucosyltransferase A-like n=1 Tax=Dermacentor silvarum TaxID=543639 RepID=UPI002101649C|nr:glycoprotein 3-alpha-L-fucosyltransferase A-like [Dermacentor silvarum]